MKELWIELLFKEISRIRLMDITEKIISNFKEMKKLKQKYLVFSPDKNKNMADSYKHWQYILKKFYL